MNWRDIGDIKPVLIQGVLLDAGSPLINEASDLHEASSPHSALCLAMLHMESSYATAFNRNIPENRNPLNLRPPNGTGYMAYSSWTEGIRSWRERITDPTYKQGIYARTKTLEELIHVYAPGSDNNNEAEYVKSITDDLARWGVTQEEPMPITFGKVPYPAIVPSYLPASNPLVQEGGAPDVPDAIFWHRMVGSLLGTDGWFHGGHAATAYGVGVAARDGAALAGVIYEWIKPRTGWYGESSGPAVTPYGDGSKFINEVTVNGVNRRSKAIEISGDVNTPLDEKSRHAIAHMTAYWADQKKIPWDVFPIIPGSTRSYVIWHNEITGMAYKTCPGTVVMNETSALIERTRQVMKQYQTAGSPTPEPPPPPVVVPQKPTWFDHGLRTQTDQHDGDLLAQYVERIMKVSPKHKSQKRTSANRGAPVVEVLQPGAKVTSAFMSRIDGLDWMWDQDGWAYQLNSFTPKIALPLKPRP